MNILKECSRRRKEKRAAGSERPGVRWFGWCKWWVRSSPAWVHPKQKACPAHRHGFHELTGIWDMAGGEFFLSLFFAIPVCHESGNVAGTNRTGLHVGSLPLTFAFRSFCYSNHWKAAVYSCKHTSWPASGNLPLCLNVKLKWVFFSLQGDFLTLSTCGWSAEKKTLINTLLFCKINGLLTLLPHLLSFFFQKKKKRHPDPNNMVILRH